MLILFCFKSSMHIRRKKYMFLIYFMRISTKHKVQNEKIYAFYLLYRNKYKILVHILFYAIFYNANCKYKMCIKF